MVQILALLIPIIALCIPIVAILVKSPIGQAIAKAIENKWASGSNDEIKKLSAEITSLKQSNEYLETEIKHLKEDYTFVEKLLKEATAQRLIDTGKMQN